MFNWNTLPVTRNDARQLGPLGCLYTPYNNAEEQVVAVDEVASCAHCQGFYSRLCPVVGGQWVCVLCGGKNPAFGATINGFTLDEDDYEYAYPHSEQSYVLIIDLNIPQQEWDVLIHEIVISLEQMNGSIAVISFDNHSHLWDPHHQHTFTFKDASSQLNKQGDVFTTDKHQIVEHLHSLHPVIQHDDNKTRSSRATGLALSIASKISSSANSLLFISGPCTAGPGSVVSLDKSKNIRTFHDIQRNNTPLMHQATKFYQSLDLQLSVFISCMDQIGLMEMSTLVDTVVMCDSFDTNLFKQSYHKLVNEVTHAHMEVLTCKSLSIRGFLGPGTVIKQGKNLSDEPLGKSGGNTLKLSLMKHHTVGAMLHMTTVGHSSERMEIAREVYIQFRTWYSGKLRVTTLKRSTMNSVVGLRLTEGFDQEAWITLMCRSLCYRQLQLKSADYDEQFIQLFKSFGTYIPKEPGTFALPANFKLLPVIWYHLQTAPICLLSNKTPDEWCYYALSYMHSDLQDSMKIVYPLLLEYSMDGTSQEVPLTSQSIKQQSILLMDSFFHLVVHHGDTVRDWKGMDLDKVEYQQFYSMLEAPKEYKVDRLPLPRYVECDEGDSQSRFLRAKLLDELVPWWSGHINSIV